MPETAQRTYMQYLYSHHFTDEKTGPQRCSNLPRAIKGLERGLCFLPIRQLASHRSYVKGGYFGEFSRSSKVDLITLGTQPFSGHEEGDEHNTLLPNCMREGCSGR